MSVDNEAKPPYEFPHMFITLLDICRMKLLLFLGAFLYRPYFTFLGVTMGKAVRVVGCPIIRMRTRGSIALGDNVSLRSALKTNLVGMAGPVILDVRVGGKILIGKNSGMSAAVLSSKSLISIGQYVKLGGNVRIFDHDFHSLNYELRRNASDDRKDIKTEPVLIDDDVFVGANTIILKGVHIGARAIVAAGSVVVKSVPEDEVWGGAPARFIRKRL